VGIAVVAALVASLPIDAEAKPKQTLSAVVDGHGIKLKNRQIKGAIAASGGTSITGGSEFHHLGQIVKSLVVTCPARCSWF
jgi:hypothetical protein